MKKILLFASALAGLFLAGSCQKETLEPAAQGGVTYEIMLPDGPQTKGEAGYEVYDLHYEVYKTADPTKLATTPLLFEKTVTMNGNTTTVTLDLLNDQDYTVLFWANKAGANENNLYFDLTDLRNVVVKTATANNDNRDAFCGMDQLVQHDGAQSKTVELKRPFAQINIATLVPTKEDIGYEVTPTHSYVNVSSIPTTFNVFTGRPADNTVAAVAFSTPDNPADIPGGMLKGTDYNWVAMNYILVPESVVEVYYEIKTVNGIVKNTIPNVPVKKNYRTNIIGNLLTSNATYTIEVVPGFEEGDLAPHPIYLAAANGGEVTLTEDLDLGGKTLEIKGDMSLNLNGKTVTGVMTVEDGADVTIENGKIVNADKAVSGITTNGNLTLNDVEIESARHAVRVESGKVVINGGTYKVVPVSNSTLHALNVGDNGTEAEVIIKGGTFIGPKGTSADSGSAVNVRTGSKVTIEGGDFSRGKNKTLACGGTLTVKGGSFDQDPAAFVADGYKVMEKDGKFYVVSEETDGIVSGKADLQQALKAAVANGETDIVIDAEGAEFDMNYGLTKANVPEGTTVTIRNANVNAKSYGNGVNGTVIFEDCIFNNANGAYSIHFDNGSGDVIFKNCALYGWNSFGSSLNSVSFENCTLNGNGMYALIRSYVNLSLKNCTIDTSNADHTDEYSEGVEAVNGATLTEENVVYVVHDTEALKAFLASDSKKIALAPGTYEGTFHVLKEKEITSVDAVNKAMIKGRVHVNSVNATFTNVDFDRNETNSNEPNNTASNALQYKAVVMIYGDQTHTIKFDGCNFYNNNGTHRSAITNVACDLIVDNCYFEGYSSSIYSQANLSVTNSTFNYTGGNNVILSINGCGDAGGKVIFKNNVITNKIFALSQFLSTVDFGNGTYHFDVQGNTGPGFDYYFLNEYRVANKTFAEGSVTF